MTTIVTTMIRHQSQWAVCVFAGVHLVPFCSAVAVVAAAVAVPSDAFAPALVVAVVLSAAAAAAFRLVRNVPALRSSFAHVSHIYHIGRGRPRA